jgi:hypothetical protein
MTEAAAYLGVSRTAVKKTIQSGKIFRDSYSIIGSAGKDKK